MRNSSFCCGDHSYLDKAFCVSPRSRLSWTIGDRARSMDVVKTTLNYDEVHLFRILVLLWDVWNMHSNEKGAYAYIDDSSGFLHTSVGRSHTSFFFLQYYLKYFSRELPIFFPLLVCPGYFKRKCIDA